MKQQRVKGYYFLFTLGFLLVFSSGFFAFLAWDGPGYQGSAAALEQPVSPPTIAGRSESRNPQGHATTKPAATLESPETQPPVVVADELPAKVATPTDEVKQANQQEPPSQGKALEAKPEVSGKAVPKPKADTVVPSLGHGVQSEKKTAAVKEAKTPTSKPKIKSRKARRTPVAPVDETKIPPEWDWFSTPLRMSMKDHKVEIVSDPSLASPETPQSQALHDAVTTGTEEPTPQDRDEGPEATAGSTKDAEPTSSVVPFTTPEESEAYAQRLNNILARLQGRREKRVAEASAHALVLPSARNDLKMVETTGNDSHGEAESAGVPVTADENLKSDAPDAKEGLPPLPSDYPADGTGK